MGDADTITTGIGSNVVFGGTGADQITAGIGNNIILGDSGRASFNVSGGKSILSSVTSTDFTTGASDRITSGNGKNIIFGGAGADTLSSGSGFSLLAGDNASAVFNSTGLLVSIQTEGPTDGSGDTISSTDGRTVVLGGAGEDRITTGRGNDVILGDNGKATFVSSGTTPTSIGSIVFSNDGTLTDIASTDADKGAKDTITGSDGFNVIVGGFGADEITGGVERDIVIGDNGHANFDNKGVLLLIESTFASVGGSYDDKITVGNGADTVIGGNGNDNIQAAGDISDEVIIGDNGKATFDSTAGKSILRDIISTDTSFGGDDTIDAGDGYNIVIGGAGKDHIKGGANNDVILGDSGHAVFNAVQILTNITTISPDIGDKDSIDVGNGSNTVLSGAGDDEVTGGDNGDVVIGDNGNAKFTEAGVLTDITTTEPGIGGNDIIDVKDGFNVVLAGNGADEVTGGKDRDVVLGDNGNATFTTDGILIKVTTSDAEVVGSYDDRITTGEGSNLAIGGNGKDTIKGGTGDDVVVGDNGRATFDVVSGAGVLNNITTIDPTYGDDDIIDVAGGNNVVISGLGTDYVNVDTKTLAPTGSAGGDDVIVGDNGYAEFNTTSGVSVLTYITTATAESVSTTDHPGYKAADVGTPELGAKDYIYAGDGNNTVLGGAGGDVITGGKDRDVVLGDDGNATFTAVGILTYLTTSDPTIGGDDVIKVGDGDNFVIGGFGADQITGGKDRDVVLGDNGNATFTTVGVLTYITTTQPGIGGDDVIKAGDGFNVILAGFGADQVTGGTGRDFILGDNGNATFDSTGGQSILREFISTDTDIGGDDTIDAGTGNNIVFGGTAKDSITTGGGDDIALGDSGRAVFDAGGILTFLTTITPAIGGDDVISVGDGYNIVLAGFGADRVTGGTGRDLILGDNGNATFDSTGGQSILREFISTDTDIGGNDIIDGGSGNNIVFGGTANDTITTGGGDDIALGDSGRAIFYATGILEKVTTITPDIGGDDIINVGDGFNIVFGGFGKDNITSGDGVDRVLGDNGYATFNDLGVLTYLTTTDHAIGDDDRIFTNGGDDMIFGGTANDYIDSGSGEDTVFGDFAYFSLEHLIDHINHNYAYPRGTDLLEEDTGGNDTIFGGSGDDYLLGEGGDDYIDGQAGYDTIFAGWGNDILHGGSEDDIMMGGPGYDFLDSGWGSDILYVDLDDTWNGGMPEDTIMGGPFFSTNTQLAFGLPVLGAAGGLTNISIFDLSITAAQLSIIIGNGAGGGYQLTLSVPSSILVLNPVQMLFSVNFNDLRWGGSGSSFALLALGEHHATLLIGIGEFLEVLWSDLLALING